MPLHDERKVRAYGAGGMAFAARAVDMIAEEHGFCRDAAHVSGDLVIGAPNRTITRDIMDENILVSWAFAKKRVRKTLGSSLANTRPKIISSAWRK